MKPSGLFLQRCEQIDVISHKFSARKSINKLTF